jgi:hypothetical protein
MSRHQKLIEKFLSCPKNFSYDELKTILRRLGYQEMEGGKTSGSRVAFHNPDTHHIIRLHKPHPARTLKEYQLDLIIEELKTRGVL